MLKRLIVVFFMCCHGALAVCPVGVVQPVKNIKEEIEKQLSPIMEYVLFSQTPTGFVISFNNNIIFDNCDELSLTGKLLLVQMAQIIKNSGHKWEIYCHSNQAQSQLDRISKTTEQAVKITHFLTDTEQCLLNQIIPIGFGSIMPLKNIKNHSQNRVDFIVEDFKLGR